MWIFGKHRHIKPDLLSQYLDGRLSLRETERVARAAAGCAHCREELESRRDTLSLLRELPNIPLPRPFTMAAPPLAAPAGGRPMNSGLAALPTWAYAGAAALAGIALSLLVLADAGGLSVPQNNGGDEVTVAALPQAAAPSGPAAPPEPAAQGEAMAAAAAAAPAPQREQPRPRVIESTEAPRAAAMAEPESGKAAGTKEVVREVPVEVVEEVTREAAVETSGAAEPAGEAAAAESFEGADSVAAPTPTPMAASIVDSGPPGPAAPAATAAPQIFQADAAAEPAEPPVPAAPSGYANGAGGPQGAQGNAGATGPQGPAGPSGYANGAKGPQGTKGDSAATPIPTPTATLPPTLTPTPTAAPPTATPAATPTSDAAAAPAMVSGGRAMPPPTATVSPARAEPSPAATEKPAAPESGRSPAGGKIPLRILEGIAAALTLALLVALVLKLRRNRRASL